MMHRGSIPAWLLRLARQQPLYLMIASAVFGIFWAITGQASSLIVTLIYSFLLGNFTALVIESVPVPCLSGKSTWCWLLNVAVLIATTAIAVTATTTVVFVFIPPVLLPPAPRDSFWRFLMTAWKFPAVANLIFGSGYLLYKTSRDRLEQHNQKLQQIISTDLVERELDARELQQARDIQRGLLPREIPQPPGFAITGTWEPAKVVGGDYFDVIQLGKNKLGICIADVVGKGISAAMLMANVQASLRAFASETAAPCYVCSRINSVLCANLAAGKFVTLFYGVLDPRTRTLQYTNAGHLSPILIDRRGKTSRLENGGALLGVFPDWRYEDSEIVLEPGDLLLLFTDGITEAMAPNGEEFGESRLIATAATSSDQSLDNLQSRLLEQVKNFCNSHMSDDATLILLAAADARPEETNIALNRNRGDQSMQYAGAEP